MVGFTSLGFQPLSEHSQTYVSDLHKVARALQGWFIPSLIFMLKWKHFETQPGKSEILKENTEVPVQYSGGRLAL